MGVLDFCSIQTEEAMIRRVAGKARNSYSTKQREEYKRAFQRAPL